MTNGTEKNLDLAGTGPGGVLAWEAPEFVSHAKSWRWIAGIWSAALALALLALWGNGPTTFIGISAAAVLLLAALALTVQGRVKPKLIRISIEEAGVSVAGRMYEWEELTGFWLVFEENAQVLYLETHRRFLSVIAIQLGKADPDAVRAALLPHLPERTDRAEELTDRLGRIIRF